MMHQQLIALMALAFGICVLSTLAQADSVSQAQVVGLGVAILLIFVMCMNGSNIWGKGPGGMWGGTGSGEWDKNGSGKWARKGGKKWGSNGRGKWSNNRRSMMSGSNNAGSMRGTRGSARMQRRQMNETMGRHREGYGGGGGGRKRPAETFYGGEGTQMQMETFNPVQAQPIPPSGPAGTRETRYYREGTDIQNAMMLQKLFKFNS